MRLAAVFGAALALLALQGAPGARAQREAPSAPVAVAVAELPAEARRTVALIHAGGPFPHAKDGIVFGNREGRLPKHKRGYYHEYTVKMPGSHGRGAHRIVCGGDQRSLGDCWYSDDHYQSFKRIHMR